MIIVEAADAFVAIVDAVTVWARALAAGAAFALCVLLFAVGPLVAPAARTVRRAPSWALGAVRARRLARQRTWPQDYREAA